MAKVLVVEDDVLTLMASAEGLRKSGLAVLEAETAEAALHILKHEGPNIALVFSDIETGGSLDGVELARAIAEDWPSITVILTSGRMTPPECGSHNIAHFFRKPYDIERICHLIKGFANKV